MTTPEKTADGRAIITREPAYVTHMFGKPVKNSKPLKGITQLLLDDESTVFECADCQHTNPDVQIIIRHRGKHAPGKNKYTPEVLAKVMQYWNEERKQGLRGVNERVALRINAERIPTTGGGKWYASTVSALHQAHKADYPAWDADLPSAEIPYQARKAAPAVEMVQVPPSGLSAGLAADQIKMLAEWLAGAVVEAESRCDHSDYDELKLKAAMLDQMRTFMGQGE